MMPLAANYDSNESPGMLAPAAALAGVGFSGAMVQALREEKHSGAPLRAVVMVDRQTGRE